MSVKRKRNLRLYKVVSELMEAQLSTDIGILAPLSKDKKLQKVWSSQGRKRIIRVRSHKTIGEVGGLHEFGGVNDHGHQIPQRSFLRSTFSEEKKGIRKDTKKKIGRMIKEDIKIWLHEIMEEIAVSFTFKVKEKFFVNTWKPLRDPSRNGKNPRSQGIPLVDTGELRRSITHRFIKGAR